MKKVIVTVLCAITIAGTATAQKEKKAPPPPPTLPTEEVAPPPPPEPPPPPLVKEIEALPHDYQEFLKRNPNVTSLRWKEESVTIVSKGGKKESFPLTEEGIKQVETKYGKLPAAPPPPPLPPPPPPRKKSKS